ncbi:hypothetical protein NQZ79_g2067 [Umbelopsis isabellina]|nr:hypothetical protein NQZ79_g2067 [Umbelopsis isabellina]
MFETSFKSTNEFLQAGYAYALFIWGLFLLYSIGEQAHRLHIYLRRRTLTTGKDVTPFKPFPQWQRTIHKTITIPFVTESISVKHVMYIVGLLAVNLIFIFCAPFTVSGGYMLPVADISNRRCVYVGLANFTIAFTVITRNSVLSKLASFSFDELVPFHRWYTKIGLAECAVHIGYQIWKGYNKFGNAKDSLFYDMEYQSGTIATFGFLIIYLTSFEFIRRNYFEVFYYSHLVGVLMAVGATFAHQYGAIAFLAPGVFLWVIDRAIRFYNSNYTQTETISVEAAANQPFTRIVFRKENLEKNFVPGQYVFLSIRQSQGVRKVFDTLNWHPFTISEILPAYSKHEKDQLLERGKISEVIKVKDQEKSSDEAVSSTPTSSPTAVSDTDSDNTAYSSGVASVHIKDLEVSVDGPFGANNLHFQDFETVILFSAGVGVTPSLTILKDLVERRSKGYSTVRTKTIHFLWSLRKSEHADAFISILSSCNDLVEKSVQPLTIVFQLFVSEGGASDKAGLEDALGRNVIVHLRKADIPEIIDDLAKQHNTERVAVQTCGPAVFMRQVQNAAAVNGWSIRTETFEF